MTIDWGAVAAQVANRPHEVARHEYEYVSAAGEPLHRTVRVDRSDGSKMVWQQRFEDGWQNGLGDVQTVLYRLPRVLEKASAGGLVVLVEGEKVVEALETLGFVATTNPMGAGSWRDEYALPLRGAYVVLCPDCDLEGRRHVVNVGRSLLEAGVTIYGPLELGVHHQTGYDLFDYLGSCAETLRAVDPGLDRMAVRRRLRRIVLMMLRHCLPATAESLAGYVERADWRADPKGRELRYCERCKRDRPHMRIAGIAYCPCGGLQI
jgi:hypothetical protein